MKRIFTIHVLLILFTFIPNQGVVYAQNFWQQTNGPITGIVNTIAINTNGNLYSGTNGGIYRSLDNGNSWIHLNNFMSQFTILSLAFNSAGDIFAGTYGEGLYQSTDNGNNWTILGNGMNAYSVYSVTFNSEGHIFACTSSGLFRSTDNGLSWTLSNIPASTVFSVAVKSNGDMYAASSYYDYESSSYEARVYLSTDNGAGWARINDFFFITPITSMIVNSDGNIFVVANGEGLYRSTTSGISWVLTNLPSSNLYTIFSDKSGNLFAGTLTGLYKSTDNGQNWNRIINGISSNYVLTFALNSTGHIFAGTVNGVFKSTDQGNNWNISNCGLTASRIIGLVGNPSGSMLAGTEYSEIFRTTDKGDNWVQTNFDKLYLQVMAVNSSGGIYAATLNCMYYSSDNGDTWTPKNNGLSDTTVTTIAFSKSGNILAGTNGGIFRSTDDGNSWVRIRTSAWVYSLAYNTNGDIYAGIYGGEFTRSTDNGNTWNWINPSTYMPVTSLAVNNAGNIFADAGAVGLFRSTDNGITWTVLNTGLIEGSLKFVKINTAGFIYSCTSNGVYCSTDNGDNWTNLISGLTDPRIHSLAFSEDGFIFAGTQATGVFRSNNPFVGIKDGNQTTNSYLLQQNYPNPFNPSTTINYSLPKPGNVKLSIYNLLGSKVATIVDEFKPAGNYSVQFNGSNLASGIYLYRLESGIYSTAKKLILLK
jgi:photosystem II stability/assembly factor-like uncharacterized protein